MRWTVHLDGGPRRVNHAAVTVGYRVFSFGGYCTGENYRDMLPCDVFVLNTHNMRWSAIPKPDEKTYNPGTCDWPYQRYGHSVVAWNQYVVLFGGRSDSRVCNLIYVFNTINFTWKKYNNTYIDIADLQDETVDLVSGQIPPPRDGHSACVIGDNMFIYGGYVESQHRFCSDVYNLNLKTMKWRIMEARGESPRYRDFHTSTAIGDKIFVFGGRCSPIDMHVPEREFYCNKVVCFDLKTGKWTRLAALPDQSDPDSDGMPEGRRSHSALNLKGSLVIFGGFNSRTDQHKNDLWEFKVDSNTWVRLNPSGKGPSPRRRQAFCLVGSRIFVFGGTSPYDGPPIKFTPRQLEFMPRELDPDAGDVDGRRLKLLDHSEMFVLDLSPSLKTLCIEALTRPSREKCSTYETQVPSTSSEGSGPADEGADKSAVDWKALAEVLPRSLMEELTNATLRNNLSDPLPIIDNKQG